MIIIAKHVFLVMFIFHLIINALPIVLSFIIPALEYAIVVKLLASSVFQQRNVYRAKDSFF